MSRLFGWGRTREWPPRKREDEKKPSQATETNPPPPGTLQVFTNPPTEGQSETPAKSGEPPKLDSLDILAFTIAMFQIILPYFLVLVGAILAVYGLFWLLFRH
ncbi:MAG TPA: hypothetical protein VGL40_07975 [Bacillota bacterium]